LVTINTATNTAATNTTAIIGYHVTINTAADTADTNDG
jgi:hypothetical protein